MDREPTSGDRCEIRRCPVESGHAIEPGRIRKWPHRCMGRGACQGEGVPVASRRGRSGRRAGRPGRRARIEELSRRCRSPAARGPNTAQATRRMGASVRLPSDGLAVSWARGLVDAWPMASRAHGFTSSWTHEPDGHPSPAARLAAFEKCPAATVIDQIITCECLAVTDNHGRARRRHAGRHGACLGTAARPPQGGRCREPDAGAGTVDPARREAGGHTA